MMMNIIMPQIKKGIYYKEKQDGDVKGYIDKNEGDEEGCSDEYGILS